MWVQLHSIHISATILCRCRLVVCPSHKVLTHYKHFYYTSRASNKYVNTYYTWGRILIAVKCMTKIRHHDFVKLGVVLTKYGHGPKTLFNP